MRPKWTASSQAAAGKVIAQRLPPQMSGPAYRVRPCCYAATPMPSHAQTLRSTERSCSAVSVPRRFISRTVGTVTMPCASNAPGRKNLTGTETSNRD